MLKRHSWGALEGKAGDFIAEEALAIEPFFQAAQEAGLYIIARPGPYINAEASGGGFPGWLQRVEGKLRTNATDYLAATDNYMANVGALIAKYQITNGGPIILVQVENEYTRAAAGVDFPNGYYMQYVEDQLHDAGIIGTYETETISVQRQAIQELTVLICSPLDK